jgi:YD repeat-containing protein
MGRGRFVVSGLVLGLLPLAGLATTTPTAAALPAGFVEQTVFSGLTQPMAVEFAQDGRVYVAEKSGLIKVFDGLGDTTATTVADLRTKVHNYGDRGLMALALAPTFPTDPSVYVLYTHDAAIGATAPRWGTAGGTADDCPNPPGGTADGCVVSGRLSRLNASLPGGGTEQVLVEDWCQQYPSHSVGDLAFGPDGYLYASAGDGASYTFADYGQDGNPVNPCGDPPAGVGGAQSPPGAEGGALRSQDVQTPADPQGLDGTIIRIDPATGQGAPGNPMITSTDPNARRLIAAGLRNPYRFTFRPGTGELWLGDVGWSSFEEINRVANPTDTGVDNFGWPCREGNAANSAYGNLGLAMCTRIANGTVPTVGPHYTYQHGQPVVSGDGCPTGSGSSTSGVAFYEGGNYPAQYDGALFFTDYSRQCIWVMFPGAGGVPDPSTRTLFRQSSVFAVDLEIGPNGDLYYVDIAAGAVRKIRYATGDQPPVAAITATPEQGALPLPVSFSAAASTDPEGAALTYAWDLDGDGQFDDATGVTAARTYTVAGAYTVSVRATDPGGQFDVQSRRILAGTTPPVPTISTPAVSLAWSAGQNITFSGSAVDPENGTLPASALSWRMVLHHCITVDACHEHPLTGFDGVASGTFTGPDHEYPAHVEVRLTATDSTGVSTTVSRRIDPRVTPLTVETVPAGLSASVTNATGTGPFTVPGIAGSRLTLATPATQTIGSTTYTFSGWSDGGARVHDITVPATATTYRATFTTGGGGDPGLIAAYSFDDGTGTALADRTGRGHTGTVSGATWSASGRYGGALSFDGVNDLVTVADANDLDLTTGMTVSAWLRPTVSDGWRTAVMKEQASGLSYALYSAGLAEPSGYVHVGGDRSAQGPTVLPVNTWSHLAVTYDSATIRLYVNGTQVASQAQAGAMTVSGSPLRLGGNSVWGEYFAGLMDDVRVYGRALTAAEIAADRDAPVSGDTVAPSAPGGPTATGGLGTVALSWTASTDNVGVTGYDVHRSTTSGFTPSAANRVATVAGTSHGDSGLAAGTYHYRVVARDGAGNSSPASAQASAVVTADTTGPTVSVTAPASGAIVSAVVTVTATAADAGGIAGVQFRLDGAPLGAEDTSAPYSASWNTTTVTNGAHTLTAVARDQAGNPTTSAPVAVTVNNTAPPAGAPVASYNFDEGSGTTLVDRTGRGYTGTVAGATWSASGRYGGALSFDGVNDLVTIADAADLDLTTAMTIEAWVRPVAGTSDWRTVLMKERPDGLCYALYADNAASRPSGYLRVGSSDAQATGTAALAANTWAHLAMTYDGTIGRLYVNGTQVATVSPGGAMTTSAGALVLGGNSVWGEYFAGLIDDVRIYDRVLTPAQLATDLATRV